MVSGLAHGSNHVLVIDDNKDILEDFRKILLPETESDALLNELEAELFGDEAIEEPDFDFEVSFADQGKTGFEMVQANLGTDKQYSLAFIDMRMPPGWDGVETAQKIWSIDPEIEIIFCTAYSDYSIYEMRKAFQNSNFLLIRKPFDSTEIIQAAHALCQKWHLNQHSKAEMQLVRKQLLQSDKMSSVGQLAAGVMHEINNPMSFVSANVNLLSNYCTELFSMLEAGHIDHKRVGPLKEEIMALLSESKDGVARVTEIVADLQSFSHAGEAIYGEIDLVRSLESTLKIINTELRYKAQIEKHYGFDGVIEGVGSQINQVLLNLLVNASHAIEEEGVIKITTGQADNNQVFIEVTDNGSGIEPQHMERIFEPFYTTKGVGKGTGLGLSLSYGIIENHHGNIEVDSVPGEYTTFRVRLPRSQPQTQ